MVKILHSQGSGSFKYYKGITPPPGIPRGVTLQAIDGETMLTPTTMSHNYFSSNGLTFASSTTYNAGTPNWVAGYSWDNPNFFLLSTFYAFFDQFTVSDLPIRINVSTSVTGNADMSLVMAGGYWAVPQVVTPTTIEIALSNAVCGLHIDEQDPAAYIPFMPNSTQDGRMWDVVGTFNAIVHGDIGGVAMSNVLAHNQYTTPNSTLRSVDTWGADLYWFSGDTGDSLPSAGDVLAIPMAFGSTPATASQCARGSNYGNMIDVYRAWGNGTLTGVNPGSDAFGLSAVTSRLPFLAYIEIIDVTFGRGGRVPFGYEVVWGLWSSIIHGARGVSYFATFWDHAGIEAAVTAAHNLLISLVRVINSPFALGYLTSVSPHGYIFPIYELNWLNGGVEACVKCSEVDGTFYIFATTREPQTTTNLSATFTLAPNVVATTATVINESRTIPIVGNQFTDTFANAWTVHIYAIS